MKTKLPIRVKPQNWLRGPATNACLLAVAVLLGQDAGAADILWSGAATAPAAGTGWTNVLNWTGGVVPGSGDNAVFDSAFTGSPLTVNKNPVAFVQVGAVTLGTTPTIPLVLKAQSSSVNPTTLVLNGVGGILLSNASTTVVMAIVNTNSVNASLFHLGLANSGIIYANSLNPAQPPTTAGSVEIRSAIIETNGSKGITKTGPGILYLRGTNNYSGATTNLQGDIEVDSVGTIGNGAGTLYLSGGNLLSGADRSGTTATTAAIPNPIMLTADTYIYNKAGTADSTRRLPLSGSLSGTGGTLKIANPTAANNQTFIVRLFGSFTFNRPVEVGQSSGAYADLSGIFNSYSVLELCNSNGVQTFNGDISERGSVIRDNPLSLAAAGGASVFTGNNTYLGGTLISSGTLFANNAAGSALGSGAVTVTNLGTLGGSGSVIAVTTINLNGTISPGATTSAVANLAVSDLTFGPGAIYNWQISAATGTAGTAWDLITCSAGWTDAAGGNAVTVKIDSQGLVPTGWNSATAYDWVIVSSGVANSFDPSHFTVDTTLFSGAVNGGFTFSVVGGSLHLKYIPGSDFVINVPSGSQGQTAGYGTITGATNVVKIGNGEVVFDNAANTYGGQTKILAGTLSLSVDALNGSGALGANSSATFLGNTNGTTNATLNISVAAVTDAHNIIVRVGSSGTKTIGTTITSGTATFAGDVALSDNAALTAPAGGSVVYSGNFSGSGGITFSGGGTYTMGGVGSYTGTSTLAGGTLNLNAKALGTNVLTISGQTTLDNTSGASVTLNSCPQNWNTNFTFIGSTNLNLGAGPVTMSGTRTLTVNSSTLTVGGTIAGNGGLIKLGAGTLALTGATNNTYTGGTTNSAGVLAINSTATFGDGTGTLLLNGGSILSTGTRSGLPISNPVVMTTDATIYGNSTASAPSSRIIPFSGNWTVSSGTLRIGNTGLANNTFEARFIAGNNVTWPVVVGDPAFDTPGAISVFELYDSNTNPVQIVSGLISGGGVVRRGNLAAGTGGTSVFTGDNTYSGGTVLDSGTIGIGLDSTPTSGTLTSGPLGTGTFEIDNDPTIFVFASGGARTIGNRIFLNGVTNTVFNGANALTFSGIVNLGGTAKTLTVSNTAPVTFSGQLTNSAAIITAGPGKLILSGDNSSRTNTTTVNAGTLLVNNTAGSGTGSGAVAVISGGTLGGTVTFASGAQAYLYKTAGFPDSPLTLSSNLTLNGNTVMVDLGGTTTLGAGTYRLLNFAGSLSGSFNATPTIVNGSLASGNAATISLSTPNQVNLVVAPASSTPPGFPPGSLSRLPSGNISLTATGVVSTPYRLWASTNLALAPVTNAWTLLQSGTIPSSPFTNYDLTATNFPQRFYLFSTP